MCQTRDMRCWWIARAKHSICKRMLNSSARSGGNFLWSSRAWVGWADGWVPVIYEEVANIRAYYIQLTIHQRVTSVRGSFVSCQHAILKM